MTRVIDTISGLWEPHLNIELQEVDQKSKFHFLLYQKAAKAPLGGTIAYILKFQNSQSKSYFKPSSKKNSRAFSKEL